MPPGYLLVKAPRASKHPRDTAAEASPTPCSEGTSSGASEGGQDHAISQDGSNVRHPWLKIAVVSISEFADVNSPVPEVIGRISPGAPVVPVSINGEGGMTFCIGTRGQRRFAKWAPAGSPIDLSAEMERLQWAVELVPVPRVLDFAVTETGTYLLTAELRGDSAITDHWKAHPDLAVRAAGSGLRALHDALPIDTCLFDWSVDARLAQRMPTGAVHEQLPPPPTIDRLVVCHGDAWYPIPSSTPQDTSSGMLISATSDVLIAGPTSRSPRGAQSGTTAQAGKISS